MINYHLGHMSSFSSNCSSESRFTQTLKQSNDVLNPSMPRNSASDLSAESMSWAATKETPRCMTHDHAGVDRIWD